MSPITSATPCASIDQITSEHARLFIEAKGNNGDPSVATTHIRRSALRLMFRIARVEFDFDGDPTLDIDLPPRSSLAARPLTDDEVSLGRSFSANSLTATRLPAAWALGEASATTAELPHITIDDLDLDCADGPRVWLHGSRKRVDHWARLDEWRANDSLEKCTRTIRQCGCPTFVTSAITTVAAAIDT